MIRKAKVTALTTVGGVLALSFVAFLALLLKYCRQDDPNNEDELVRQAEAAERADDPPKATLLRRRLLKLNPFDEGYREKYIRALVRMRDFDRLTSLTNSGVGKVELTASEAELERLIRRGSELVLGGSNAEARVAFAAATNLNYYAAAPFLIDVEARLGRVGVAYRDARDYLARFCEPLLLFRAAEWGAAMGRSDLIDELAKAGEKLPARPANVFGYYSEALKAWIAGDGAALKKSLAAIPNEVKTAMARMMALEVACAGDDAYAVETRFRELRERLPYLDFDLRGRVAVKRFVSDHFPSKLPIDRLGSLAELVQENAEPDVDMARVSLLAKLAAKTLDRFELDRAVRLFPDDRGIRLLKEEYERASE